MTASYRRLLSVILVLAGVGAGCSQNAPFALRCKSSTGAGPAQNDLFVIAPVARKIFRQTPQGWERGVPAVISDDRIFGQIPPTRGQVGIRYDFDRTSGSGEKFIGSSDIGIGLTFKLEECTSVPVPEAVPLPKET